MNRWVSPGCFSLVFLLSPLLSAQTGFSATSSPFADQPCNSYSNYTDKEGHPVHPKWGDLHPDDFGSRTVTFDQTGVRKISQVPPPGVHPRILFTPEQLPDIVRRLKETRCGQTAMNHLLCWTEMMKGKYDDKAPYAQPDVCLGGWQGLHGPVPLFRLGVDVKGGGGWNHNTVAAARYQKLVAGDMSMPADFYWNVFPLEALRCLVENDTQGAMDLAKATTTALKIDQAKRGGKIDQNNPPDQPVGAFQLAFTYDLLFNWLTPEQKSAMHDELALGTWSHDNYGTFNDPHTSRSNWATFSYWLFEVLAIEDEPGFNELKVRGMYRGWRNLLTYGWFQSGATFEGEAKNQLGMDGIIPFAMREKRYGFTNLCGHPYLQAYSTHFLPHSLNPMLDGFHKYDLLGGSRTKGGGFTPCDLVGLKYMFPDNKIIDWVYRKTVGEDYQNVPDRPDGYYNGLLFFAIFAMDYDPANNDPNKLNLGNTFFCGERSLMMTRSSWDKNALMLNLHVRQANGGHPFADRNGIMVAGAGRIWSPNNYASFTTPENSVVDIDAKTQDLAVPGRMVDFQDNPLATFAIGDAKYCWDWNWKVIENRKPDPQNPKVKDRSPITIEDVRENKLDLPPGWELEKHSTNDFSYLKLPFPYLDTPMSEAPSWIQPKGGLQPRARQSNFPVKMAFRTAGLIRGPHPYSLVIDDIQKDETVHHYDWNLSLEYDLQIAKIDKKSDREMDLYLTGSDPDQKNKKPAEPLPSSPENARPIPEDQPVLLVRVMNRNVDPRTAPAWPRIEELANEKNSKKYSQLRRLIIPADAISPDFKVLLFPYRQGAPLPTTAWNSDRTSVTVAWPDQTDQITFSPSSSGKTNITIVRGTTPVIDLHTPLAAFN